MTKRDLIAVTGAVIAAALPGAAQAARENLVVETTAGRVRGERLDGVTRFRGIPFAGSVAGRGRWSAPPPPTPWRGVRDATVFGPIIPQPSLGVPGGQTTGATAFSESEALTANVWTPGADTTKRPVMVWISCGAFTFSNGGDPGNDFEALSRGQDVVGVTFNCRPGLLGFLYLGDVLGGDYQAGNAGLLDQIAALQWVRDNISAFGGDPENVTICGCSGSGFSCASLMAMPRARGLFHRAIIESGSDFACNIRTDASEFTLAVLNYLGVAGNPQALFDIPAERLLEAKDSVALASYDAGHGSTRGGPVPCVDKVTLPAQPIDAWAAGSAADIDLIIGCNQEEMNLQLPEGMTSNAIRGILPRNVSTLAEIVETMAASCDGLAIRGADGRSRAEALVEGYQALQPDRPLPSLLNFVRSELLFRIPATRMAAAQMTGGGRPVHMYLFNWGPAFHGLEVPFVFNNLTRSMLGPTMAGAPGAQALSDRMSTAWAAFARTGSPGADWPAYSIPGRETKVFGNEDAVVADPLGAQRALWNGVVVGNRTLLASQVLGASS